MHWNDEMAKCFLNYTVLWVSLYPETFNNIQHALHYLHDFHFLGSPKSGSMCLVFIQSLTNLLTASSSFCPSMIKGKCTLLTFLGMEIDTLSFRLKLSSLKLQAKDQDYEMTKLPLLQKKRIVVLFRFTQPCCLHS